LDIIYNNYIALLLLLLLPTSQSLRCCSLVHRALVDPPTSATFWRHQSPPQRQSEHIIKPVFRRWGAPSCPTLILQMARSQVKQLLL